MVTPASEQLPRRVAVAYSAGRDSTALLHATACAAREAGGLEVWALHVHHGLSAHADAWLTHAEQTCAEWTRQGLPVRLLARRVSLALNAGESVEAEARRARYAALTEMAHELGLDLVLLAHHRRDQAETVLLQALRGAGVKGLAAMPVDAMKHGLRWVRPWLHHPREAIESYVGLHGLRFVDDDSNADGRYARNRLRLAVWPALEASFPQAEASLAACATRVQDVLPVLDAWAEGLVVSLGRASALPATGAAMSDRPGSQDGLDAARWAELSGAERRLVLAHWYRGWRGHAMPASWVQRLAHEVPGLVFHCKSVQWPEIAMGLYRGVLMPLGGRDARASEDQASLAGDLPAEVGEGGRVGALSVQAPGDLVLPAWRGVLRVTEVLAGGVPPGLLAHAQLRERTGGEQFQMGPGRPPRALKKQFQSAGIPEWLRNGPLAWAGDQLVFVPGLGVDARCLAPEGSLQWGLEWVADAI